MIPLMQIVSDVRRYRGLGLGFRESLQIARIRALATALLNKHELAASRRRGHGQK